MSKKRTLVTVLALTFCLMIPTAAFASPITLPDIGSHDAAGSNDTVTVGDQNTYDWSYLGKDESVKVGDVNVTSTAIDNTDKSITGSFNTDKSITDSFKVDNSDKFSNNKLNLDLKLDERCMNNSSNSGIIVQDSDHAFVLGIKDVTLTLTNTQAYNGNTGSFNYTYHDVGNNSYHDVGNTSTMTNTSTMNMGSFNTKTMTWTNSDNDNSSHSAIITKNVDVTKITDSLNGANIVNDSSVTGSAIDKAHVGDNSASMTTPAPIITPVVVTPVIVSSSPAALVYPGGTVH